MAELIYTSLFNDANLQAYYRLEDVSDSKGANTLTNNNSVTFTPAVYANGANLGTSNTNKYLSTSNTLSVDGGSCSISLWCQLLTEIPSATQTIVNQANNTSKTQNRIYLDFNGGTRLVVFMRGKPGVGNQTSSVTQTLGTTNVYHLVYVYDGVNVTGYINNVASTPTAASGSGSAAITNGFYIGATQDGSLEVSALIDDCGFFNRALTAAEVATLYNAGPGAFGFFM